MKNFGKLLVVTIIFFFGCVGSLKVKDVEELEPDVGLDTIPYYYPGSSDFDSNEGLMMAEKDIEDERRLREGFAEALKKRAETEGTIDIKAGPGGDRGAGTVKFDPWVAPATRVASDLPLALRGLPKDNFGYPDWTGAVERGFILPRDYIFAEDEGDGDKEYDKDVLFVINDPLMADVSFPHNTHNFWLSCDNCHPSIFVAKRGANNFNMYNIWNGEYCGRCHGKVAFQAKGFENCQRCHNQEKRLDGF